MDRPQEKMEEYPCTNHTEGTLEEKIHYRFRDGSLLQEALTHKSYSNEQPGGVLPFNERLEFLGDAVLGLIVSRYAFHHLATATEGELTRIRAEVVNEKSLAAIAGQLMLGRYLRLGRGEEKSGGRTKRSLLANAFEALLGAVFCDGGFENACRVAEGLLAEKIRRAASSKTGRDYKTRLQEMMQARYGLPPEYELSQIEGPEHQRSYTVEARFEGRVIGRGKGTTKKKAEQEAAREALQLLEGETP
ncbi:MAG: ribonuclease III [Syntrophotaleaceae bacterium]